jgi:site-specific DNA-methyltransferase (adenine-specific)
MAELGRHLDYFWLIAVRFHARGPSLCRRRIWQSWASILVYQKPPATPPPSWFQDLIDGGGREKDLHAHQQAELEAASLIETFSSPGDLIVDPCCGAGTNLVAAKSSGRRWLGAELDAGTARAARRRLAGTVPVS